MLFYQRIWETIKGDLFDFFSDFYQNGKIPESIKSTFLTLIPKKEGASVTNDFRPISLISDPCKIIAKDLSNRMKSILHEAIDGNRFAFVKERNIMAYIMIANESVEDYRHRKKAGLILKQDLEKAYNYTHWEFLDYIMARKGFGSKWRKWIYGCLQSSHFLILINGSAKGFLIARED